MSTETIGDYVLVRDEDEGPPEDYIKPGSPGILYVNCYKITRHFGGPEEGGWWYNYYSPLASIPIKATSKPGNEYCNNCRMAKMGVVNGERYEPCKWCYHLEADDKKFLERMQKYLHKCFDDEAHGDIYSMKGGAEINVCVETFPAWQSPQESPTYE